MTTAAASKSDRPRARKPTPPGREALIQARVDPTTKRAFKARCAETGVTMEERLNALMRLDASGPGLTGPSGN